jgi:hypothetical protein
MKPFAAVFISALLVLTCAPSASAQSTKSLPASAAQMTPEQVYLAFAGRSWVWSDGAGYFSRDSKFLAWSGAGEKSSYAEGRWRITPKGRLCWDVDWHGAGWAKRETTCFSHRSVGDAIYQKKDPSGSWYIFRHSPPAANDEFAKLQSGDLVTTTYTRIKAKHAHKS